MYVLNSVNILEKKLEWFCRCTAHALFHYISWLSFPYFFIFQEEEVTAEFLAGKVPEIVYKKAIEAVPGNVCCANKCKPQCLYTVH